MMVVRAVAVGAALLSVALGAVLEKNDYGLWTPADGVKALDAVEKAVQRIVEDPHLSPEQLTRARVVAAEVTQDVEDVKTNATLSKAERNAKVASALKELSGLQSDWAKLAGKSVGKKADLEARLATLKKELGEKKHALEQENAMIKLMKLQKELAEKKLQLQTLMDKQAAGKTAEKAQAEEARESAAMVGDLLKMASGLGAGKTEKKGVEGLPPALKKVYADLQARSRKVQKSLDDMDAAEKAAGVKLDAAIHKKVPLLGKDDPLAGEQKMLKMVRSQEKRKFAKARAVKQNELHELKEAEESIEQHDVKRLKQTLAKMQASSKAMAAKTGNFLH